MSTEFFFPFEINGTKKLIYIFWNNTDEVSQKQATDRKIQTLENYIQELRQEKTTNTLAADTLNSLP